MVVTYCTAKQVVTRLQLMKPDKSARLVLNETSFPSVAEVEEWINEWEGEIDDFTKHAWRTTSVVNETHAFRGYRRHNAYSLRSIYPIKLKFGSIVALSSPTDKLEIFDGNVWNDILATGVQGDGYGEGDFSVDLKQGRIYLSQYPTRGPNTIRVTYRYGEASTVPGSIRKACILLTCLNFLQSDDYIYLFPDNPNKIQLDTKAEAFEKMAYRALRNHQKLVVK